MSCMHYQSRNSPGERMHLDLQHSHYRQAPYSSPRIWPSEIGKNARAEAPFAEARIQTGRPTVASKYEGGKQPEGNPFERIRVKLKFLEDSNIVLQTRNQNLIRENKGLVDQLDEKRAEAKRLENRIASLEEDFDREKSTEERRVDVQTKETTTDVLPRADRGVQIWAVCKGCEKRLESCEKLPPTVTITKSELEMLEKDMQTLRDTIIAREEAWDKAMEREQNYRQQLTRLTAETITARHLSETRYEDLQAANGALSERETELKSVQKDNLFLNKLLAKLYSRFQRGNEDSPGGNSACGMSEKEQRLIEEVVRRVSSAKVKQKPKAKGGCSEKIGSPTVCQTTPRDNKTSRKDQAGSSRESKR